MSGLLAFDLDAERVAEVGGVARFLTLANADDGGGDGAAAARARDALRDAYDFSTGAQLTRYKRVRGRAYEDDDGAPP